MKFRKKPVVVEARQFLGDNAAMHGIYLWIESNTLGSFEPTSRVDALNEAVMLHSIAELADHGTAVVLVSHREQAMQIADEVVRM